MGDVATWDALTAQVTALYEAKQYAEIDALIDANAGRFPDKDNVISYTRVCVATLRGDTPRALDLLGDAARRQVWFPSARLRGDPDLAPLQGVPEFERLAEINLKFEQDAQANAKSIMPVGYPPFNAETYPALIALHGNNTNVEQTWPFWASAVQRGFLVAVPQSSQPSGPEKFVWNDQDKAEQDVVTYRILLEHDNPADLNRLVLGGFSMGGHVACALALQQKIPLIGFIAVSPWLKGFEAWEPSIDSAARAGLRGYLIVGDNDPICYTDTLALHQMLTSHGLPCGLKVYPGLRHVYSEDFDAALGDALQFILE